MSPVQCYTCKKLQSYPFVRAPLGPATVQPNSDPKTSIILRKGIVTTAWFCLPCAIKHLSSLTEEILSTPIEQEY